MAENGTSSVAQVYAEALFACANEKDLAEAVDAELNAIAALAGADTDVATFLSSPLLDAGDRKTVLQNACRGKVSDLVLDFLCLLADKGRLGVTRNIAAAYRKIYFAQSGQLAVKVRTAIDLDARHLQGLRDQLSEALDRQVDVTHSVDPGLLGGMTVQVEDRIFDGSVLARLTQMREQMITSGPDLSQLRSET